MAVSKDVTGGNNPDKNVTSKRRNSDYTAHLPRHAKIQKQVITYH
jgi:hypothetical protein